MAKHIEVNHNAIPHDFSLKFIHALKYGPETMSHEATHDTHTLYSYMPPRFRIFCDFSATAADAAILSLSSRLFLSSAQKTPESTDTMHIWWYGSFGWRRSRTIPLNPITAHTNKTNYALQETEAQLFQYKKPPERNALVSLCR